MFLLLFATGVMMLLLLLLLLIVIVCPKQTPQTLGKILYSPRDLFNLLQDIQPVKNDIKKTDTEYCFSRLLLSKNALSGRPGITLKIGNKLSADTTPIN